MAKKQAELSWQERARFIEAHKRGDLECVRQFLADHPRIEYFQPQYGTWLHESAAAGSLELVKFWLARGLDVNQNVPGYGMKDGLSSAIHVASTPQTIRFLVANGADVNSWTRYGGTALHQAAVSRDPARIKTLLELGVDPSIADIDGRTPLACAIEHKQHDAEKVLRAAGAPLEGHPPHGLPPRRTAAAPIDLRKDVERITKTVTTAINKFAKQHPAETVTAVALAASGIEGYVTVCVDTGKFENSPWDASHAGYATAQFPRWQEAYELCDRGPVRITEADGKQLEWKRPPGDAKFQAPFFRACLAALKQLEASPTLAKLKRAKNVVIGVEISSGDHADFWKPKFR